MKRIPLTQGQFALVDDDVYERLNQFKWYAYKDKKAFYARRMAPKIEGKYTIHMHHEIIGKPPKGYETDHINGCTTDNQQNNLRFVTRRQNCQNKKNQKKSSCYPGVIWYGPNQKWKAKITINGKPKHLGYFCNELEAFEAYKQAVEAIGEKMIEGL